MQHADFGNLLRQVWRDRVERRRGGGVRNAQVGPPTWQAQPTKPAMPAGVFVHIMHPKRLLPRVMWTKTLHQARSRISRVTAR